nr:type-F conjugative transfer system protein TrbI [Vibrio lentus]PMI46399.1 type-F conjugative transfer system protein TrbI [Vibrio lentus]
MKLEYLTLLLATCLSVAASVATSMVIESPPTVVSMDVKSTVEQYHRELLKSSFSVDEQSRKMADFAAIMNEEVAKYSMQHGQVVLVSAAVMEGTPDITAHIQRAIVERYTQ